MTIEKLFFPFCGKTLNTFIKGYSDYEILCAVVSKVNEVIDYSKNMTIKYANPLLWDITTQYSANTVVVDSHGNAYLSVQPVPVGIQLTDTEYWTKIGNFDELWASIKASITPFDEGIKTTASADRSINTLVWLDNTLYRVVKFINKGTEYLVNDNCVASSLNEVFSYILSLAHAKYEDETESLILGFYEQTESIAVAGDVHVFDPVAQTISIISR